MAWATKNQKTIGFQVRGRLGRPTLYGWNIYGWSQYGEDIENAGVYQGRISRKGVKFHQPIKGRHEICFMRPCITPYTTSVKRTIQTDKFKTAFAMWQSLTSEQKVYYNELALRLNRKGYNYFLSITLKSL